MKVEVIVQVSGTRDGVEWPSKGTVIDVDDEEAKGLIEAGIAVPAKEDDTEKAVAPKAEERSALTTKSGASKK